MGNLPDLEVWGQTDQQIVVQECWEKTYAVSSGHLAARDSVAASVSSPLKRKRSKWVIDGSDNEDDVFSSNPDSIEAYLDSPTITKSELKAAGGVLKYWENRHTVTPRLARMALDFLSVPACSVDAERAFSGGRLQVCHLQHRISFQSFKAQVAVGSWYGSPVLPETKYIAGIINKKMQRRKATEKSSAAMDLAVEESS